MSKKSNFHPCLLTGYKTGSFLKRLSLNEVDVTLFLFKLLFCANIDVAIKTKRNLIKIFIKKNLK
ncbi:MAG: hypothetical protein COZ21_00355 [Bacteroidetes bacterium CG_4_10_14_3_um_filter_31_20]|nr:MAG: hypothetical protein COZ21_00355 [Bacteroidetes bacterium CG_4_10_14_3_um_filter_31_20]